ncbi:uncharacterized protein [Oscarella lobularis]|uniref:uncharacterized protein isoform X2 n=1 Tax=Oscarella lobularis TaxID=121494 RepID=UPI0033131767
MANVASFISICFALVLNSYLNVSHRSAALTIESPCNTTIDVDEPQRTEFRLRKVNNATGVGAVCNDLTPAVYYISKARRGGESSRKWIVFLESGSGCGSVDDCNERYEEKFELMSSRDYVRNHSTIVGSDLFDSSPYANPDYYDYNFVLVPYCSSDLWIGRSPWGASRTSEDFAASYNASDGRNHFAFRGLVIFRTIVEELALEDSFDGCTAQEVLLAGSSAGGLGVLNHAGWLKNRLTDPRCPAPKFSTMLDSSWFINFDNNLVANFDFDFLRAETLYDLHPPCRDESAGYPCCVSARCMLSKEPRTEYDFPDVPTFFIFSLYDLYIVAESIRALEDKPTQVKYAEAFRTIAEYGGAMNFSLDLAKHDSRNMSYFVPSCLQHVYLATSNLWKPGSLFNGTVNSSNFSDTLGDTRYFRHSIRASTWQKVKIPRNNTGTSQTLQCAIHEWNRRWRTGGEPVRLTDTCFGARCNQHCPEEVRLGILNDTWGFWVGFLLDSIILFITCVALLFKAFMIARKRWLIKDQQQFLDLDRKTQKRKSRQLSVCSPSDAIGIACLNLKYSIQLSPEAYAQAKKIQEQKLAAEEESREMMGMVAGDNDSDSGSRTLSLGRSSTKEFLYSRSHAVANFFRKIFTCGTNSSCRTQSQQGDAIDLTDFVDVETGERKESVVGSPQNGHSNGEAAQEGAPNGKQNGVPLRPPKSVTKEKSWDGPPNVPREKTIISGISGYFNPSQLVAIMGPSGCGKTTFLDLMTGRRKDHSGREIFVNGVSFSMIRNWYIRHTGYVLQLAIPYYEELTVRQNLTLAAFMRLPSTMTAEAKFERVEQVIEETGLASLKNSVVGGLTGPGLSGGQKRRLCVAIQLLNMPKVLFLDEPTSGLDAASSMELLQHLSYVSRSGRMVLLTIHQPRLEIFHMFDVILFLCQGQVAYYGAPMEAPALFLKAYHFARLEGDAPTLEMANKNPADVIMDILGSERYRTAILDYYNRSYEPKAVKAAVRRARRRNSQTKEMGNFVEEDSGWKNRYFVLETRAAMRSGLAQSIYLPLIFLLYALVLGSAYWQAQTSLLIMAVFCVYSFSSSIFMFPAVYTHLSKALDMYKLEKADGIGHSHEILLQTFFRFVSISAFPLTLCTLILYLMVLEPKFWNFIDFFQIGLYTLALNQVWTSIAIMIVCLFPVHGHRISPLTSCAAGFAGGFLIPKPDMKPYYAWLFYINPNFYGYSSMMRLIMPGIDVGCDFDSTTECYPTTGEFWLEHFGFEKTEPFLGLLIILVMTFVAFFIAWVSLKKNMSGLSLRDMFYQWRMRKKIRLYENDLAKEAEEGEEAEAEEDEEGIELEDDDDVINVVTPDDSSDDDETGPAVAVSEESAPEDSGTLRRFQDHKGIRQRHKVSEEDITKLEDEVIGPKRGRTNLKRQATRSHLMLNRQHSVYCPGQNEDAALPSSPGGVLDRQSFRRLSRRDRRKMNAENLQHRAQLMANRIAYYNHLQRQMEVNENDVEGMDHDMINPETVRKEELRQSMFRLRKKKEEIRAHRHRRQSLPMLDPGNGGEGKRKLSMTMSYDPSAIPDGPFPKRWSAIEMDRTRRGSEQSSIDFNNMQPGSMSDVTQGDVGSPRQPFRSLDVTLQGVREEESFYRPSPLIDGSEPRARTSSRPSGGSPQLSSILKRSVPSRPALTPDYEPGGAGRERYLRFVPVRVHSHISERDASPSPHSPQSSNSSSSPGSRGGYDVTDIEKKFSEETKSSVAPKRPDTLPGLLGASGEEILSSSSDDDGMPASPAVIHSRPSDDDEYSRSKSLGNLALRRPLTAPDGNGEGDGKTRKQRRQVSTPIVTLTRPSVDDGDD